MTFKAVESSKGNVVTESVAQADITSTGGSSYLGTIAAGARRCFYTVAEYQELSLAHEWPVFS